ARPKCCSASFVVGRDQQADNLATNRLVLLSACSCGLHLPLNDGRQCERKGGALARLRLDPNPAAVHLNDALGYGKSEAGATLLLGDGVVGLLKLLKQPGLIGGGDARPSVADRYKE